MMFILKKNNSHLNLATKNLFLVTHMQVHANDKPFTCNICNKGFSRKSNLNRHLLSHTNEKLFTCKLCDRGFSQKSHLSRHFQIHTIEKPPITCNVCNRSFYRKSHLNDTSKHILIRNFYPVRYAAKFFLTNQI